MTQNMNGLRGRAKGLMRNVADTLWPPRSLVSGQRGVGAGPLSAGEFRALSFITDPICNVCGVPQAFDLGVEERCAACTAFQPKWGRARAALVYDEVSRRPVLDLKRSGRRDGLPTLATWMRQAGQALIDEADMMIPVPLHYRRLAARGYNQAGWLAQTLARQTSTPVKVDVLKRTKATPTQGGLSAKARRRNVSGAFDVRARQRPKIDGKRCLLIDDVLTTGATLGACTRALYKAGAANVDILVLARVVRETDVTI